MADDKPEIQHLIEAIRREANSPPVDLDALINRVAERVREEIRADRDETMNRFLERMGIEASESGFSTFRQNQVWVGERRALQSKVLEKGIGAVVAMLLGAIVTAIFYYLRGGAK